MMIRSKAEAGVVGAGAVGAGEPEAAWLGGVGITEEAASGKRLSHRRR